MFRRSLIVLAVVIGVIALGCAGGNYKPGMGGRGSAEKIEKTDHPPFPDGVSCYVCHKEDIPVHAFHKDFGNKCETCHVLTTWMAQNYPHTSWPLDEIHNVRCTRCHARSNRFDFTSYQCYGCHHEEEAVKESHAQLKTDNIDNCAACHKGFEKDTSQ